MTIETQLDKGATLIKKTDRKFQSVEGSLLGLFLLVEEFFASVFVAILDELGKTLNQFPFIGISAHLFLRACAFRFAPTQRLSAVAYSFHLIRATIRAVTEMISAV